MSGFTVTAGPWSGIPYEVRRNALIELGTGSEAIFDNSLLEIEQLIRGNSPLLTLSLLTQYGLFSGVSDAGKVREPFMGEEFSQSHVELVQALLLRIKEAELSQRAIDSAQIERLFKIVPSLSLAFHRRRLTTAFDQASDVPAQSRRLQEWVRLHTQGVRHWTFLEHAQRLLVQLCAPLDSVFAQATGVRFTSCVTIFAHLVRNNDSRITERWQRLV